MINEDVLYAFYHEMANFKGTLLGTYGSLDMKKVPCTCKLDCLIVMTYFKFQFHSLRNVDFVRRPTDSVAPKYALLNFVFGRGAVINSLNMAYYKHK